MEQVEFHLKSAMELCENEVLKEKIKGLLNHKSFVGFKLQEGLKEEPKSSAKVPENDHDLEAKKAEPKPKPSGTGPKKKQVNKGAAVEPKGSWTARKAAKSGPSDVVAGPLSLDISSQESPSKPLDSSSMEPSPKKLSTKISKQVPEEEQKNAKPVDAVLMETKEDADATEDVEAPPSPIHVQDNSPWECTKCGKENTVQLMCCGRARPRSDNFWRCRVCHFDNAEDSQVCAACDKNKPKKRPRKELPALADSDNLSDRRPSRQKLTNFRFTPDYVSGGTKPAAEQDASFEGTPAKKSLKGTPKSSSGKKQAMKMEICDITGDDVIEVQCTPDWVGNRPDKSRNKGLPLDTPLLGEGIETKCISSKPEKDPKGIGDAEQEAPPTNHNSCSKASKKDVPVELQELTKKPENDPAEMVIMDHTQENLQACTGENSETKAPKKESAKKTPKQLSQPGSCSENDKTPSSKHALPKTPSTGKKPKTIADTAVMKSPVAADTPAKPQTKRMKGGPETLNEEETLAMTSDVYLAQVLDFIDRAKLELFCKCISIATRSQATVMFRYRETEPSHTFRGYGMLHRVLLLQDTQPQQLYKEALRALVELALRHQLKEVLDSTTDEATCRFYIRRLARDTPGGARQLQYLKNGMSSPFKAATALHLACVYGDLDAAEVLLHAGCSLDVRNREGRTALSIALAAVDAPMVKLLTSSPQCSLDNVGVGGCSSALDWILPMVRLKALAEAALTITRYLCVRLNKRKQQPSQQSLFWAVATCPENKRGDQGDPHERWKACSYLLEFINLDELELENGYIKILTQKRSMDYSEGRSTGFFVSPLHIAAQACNYRLLSRLLQADSKLDINAFGGNEQDYTPLQMACQRGWTEGVGLLLAREADPHLKGKNGKTALMLACGTGNAALVTLLLSIPKPRKIDVTAKDGAGMTCFHYAAESARVAVLDQLLTFNPQGISMMMFDKTSTNTAPTDMLKAALSAAQNLHLHDKNRVIKDFLARIEKKANLSQAEQQQSPWRGYQRLSTSNMISGVWDGEDPAVAYYTSKTAQKDAPVCASDGLARGFIYVSFAIESVNVFINWNVETMNWCPCDGWQCPPSCQCQNSNSKKTQHPRGCAPSMMGNENLSEVLRLAFAGAASALDAGEAAFPDVYQESLRRPGIVAVDEALDLLVLESCSDEEDALSSMTKGVSRTKGIDSEARAVRRHALRWLIQRTLMYAQKNKINKKEKGGNDNFSDFFGLADLEEPAEPELALLLLQSHNCIEESAFAPGWHPLKLALSKEEENDVEETPPDDDEATGQTNRSSAWIAALKKDDIELKEIWEKLQELKKNIDLNHVAQPSSYYDDNGQKNSTHKTIKECNYRCLCDIEEETCKHRIVQLGNKKGLEVFWTGTQKGFGVRTSLDIQKNTYIFEYAGEYVNEDEFERRQQHYLQRQLNMQYQLHLGKYYIDATRYGNVGRFMNHACEPNVRAFEIFTDHHDTYFPRIGFFAVRDIKAGEELTWTYGSVLGRNEGGGASDCPCFCGSPKCKRFLPS